MNFPCIYIASSSLLYVLLATSLLPCEILCNIDLKFLSIKFKDALQFRSRIYIFIKRNVVVWILSVTEIKPQAMKQQCP